MRSTIPVDAQTQLTGQLGAALQQSLGQLGAQRAGDISNVRQNIGQLQLGRVNSINDLSNALMQQDFQRQQQAFEMQQARAAAAQSGGSGGGSAPSVAQQKIDLQQSLFQDVANAFRNKKAGEEGFTERAVLPALYQAYGALGPDLINKAVYQYRKNALGY